MNKKVTQKKQNHETVYIQWTANICKILIVKLKPKKAEPKQHLFTTLYGRNGHLGL